MLPNGRCSFLNPNLRVFRGSRGTMQASGDDACLVCNERSVVHQRGKRIVREMAERRMENSMRLHARKHGVPHAHLVGLEQHLPHLC